MAFRLAAGDAGQRRRLAAAGGDRDRAARMEAATGRDVRWVRHRVAEAGVGDAEPWLRREHRGEQRLRIGMCGRAEQRRGLAALDDAAATCSTTARLWLMKR